MPRKIIATPKADSVGSLIFHSRDSNQVDKWRVDEVARQREQYAEELKAQIQEKEAARAREKASSPRFAAQPPLDGSSMAMPTSSPFTGIDPGDVVYSAEEHAAVYSNNESNRQDSIVAIDAPLPKAPPPILTGRPAFSQEPTYSPPAVTPFNQQMSEKERFIASMEHGITLSPTYARRSVTLPAPLYPSTARTSGAAVSAMPLARSRTAEEEEAEALRRQQSFKNDLEIQIQEKKRQKALELEREKQWEAEQEARLEKEREELRKEFEAEHAARRAKVEADAAENAAAVSRKATANTSKGANQDVQIYAAKRRNITNQPVASVSSSVLSEEPAPIQSEPEPPLPPAQKPGLQKLADNDSPASVALDPNELSRKLQQAQQIELKGNLEEQPISSCYTNHSNNSSVLNGMPGQVSALIPSALVEQVAELKRLNEALQRDLNLHKTVLELVKDTKLAAASSNAAFAAMQPFPQPPIYTNPAALGLVQKSFLSSNNDSQPSNLVQSMNFQAPIRSLPIVYTTSKLRTEDSRPPTRMPSTVAALPGKQKSYTQTARTGAPTRSNHLHSNSDSELIKAVHKDSSVGLGTAATTSVTVTKEQIIVSEAKSTTADKTTAGCLPSLETARLGSGGAAERLGIWKKAKLKLRKLSVARPTAGTEAVWVVKEESSLV